ncbi:sporulation-delaying protein SdpB family protein [Pseudonocardia sp. ICBG601]|uniref:sporulation-delaying protein SdpB family protein n=1 Tax=Pseudonocardia sp. ICBG601 TaxID=2846759 RepID=UPI001CF62D9C|nr:sporulation-delaying protein SdpB family protein [Pseudonocardia sp. ICBG601]
MGVARSALAVGQISVLALTPATHLFVPVGDSGTILPCQDFLQTLSAFCMFPNVGKQTVAWWLVALLAVVASGLYPRFTALLHVWVSLSVHTSVSLPDGGETVLQVCTLLIALAVANDRRRWHWSKKSCHADNAKISALHGISWAGQVALTLQVAYVYLNSAVSKLKVSQWQDGTAIYYVTRMESFGVSGPTGEIFLWLTKQPTVSLALTWGVIIGETAIAILLVRRGNQPMAAFFLSCALHIGIIFLLGLVSFGIIMMGVVGCASAPAIERLLRRSHQTVPTGNCAGD